MGARAHAQPAAGAAGPNLEVLTTSLLLTSEPFARRAVSIGNGRYAADPVGASESLLRGLKCYRARGGAEEGQAEPARCPPANKENRDRRRPPPSPLTPGT
ncbi:hypothetical protein SKAU_G00314670 [Synaphobranchus kaupii]|uniref:Uncharacterized protein n=1 Tax=Synaphobranchus kaupii TaxID=118154 RepID=A0A9Q1ESB4_SYNKA|nr:hypothetical protein SKAU_G00314670 [Synaphobranchus kaupii]